MKTLIRILSIVNGREEEREEFWLAPADLAAVVARRQMTPAAWVKSTVTRDLAACSGEEKTIEFPAAEIDLELRAADEAQRERTHADAPPPFIPGSTGDGRLRLYDRDQGSAPPPAVPSAPPPPICAAKDRVDGQWVQCPETATHVSVANDEWALCGKHQAACRLTTGRRFKPIIPPPFIPGSTGDGEL